MAPAVENRGEGIFIQICNEAVAAWLERTALHGLRIQFAEGLSDGSRNVSKNECKEFGF